MDTLTVVKVRPGAAPDGVVTKRQVGYWALAVNGVPLEDLVASAAGYRHDWAGRLALGSRSCLLSGAAMLLGDERGDLPSGRVPVLVCPACGDVGCGAVGVAIRFTESTVAWPDFAYENTWDDASPYGMESFTFARDGYSKAIRSTLP